MGMWCNCVECVGYQPEPTTEELEAIEKEAKAMEVIQPIHPQDIILWPEGHWNYRSGTDPEWLQNPPASYEVVPWKSERWNALQQGAQLSPVVDDPK